METKKLRQEIETYNKQLSLHEQQTVITLIATIKHVCDHIRESDDLAKAGYSELNRTKLADNYQNWLYFHLAGMMRAENTETLYIHQTHFIDVLSQIGHQSNLKPVAQTLEELKARRAMMYLAAVIRFTEFENKDLTPENAEHRKKLLESVNHTIESLTATREQKFKQKESITDIDNYLKKLKYITSEYTKLTDSNSQTEFTELKKKLLNKIENDETYSSVDIREESQILSLARIQSRTLANTRSIYLEPAAGVKERMLDMGWIGLGAAIIIAGLVLTAVAPWLMLPALALGIAAVTYGAIDLAKVTFDPLQAALGHKLPELGEKPSQVNQAHQKQLEAYASQLKVQDKVNLVHHQNLHTDEAFDQKIQKLNTVKQRYKVAGIVASGLGLAAGVLGLIFPPLGLAIGITAAAIAVGTGVVAITSYVHTKNVVQQHVNDIKQTDSEKQSQVEAIVDTAAMSPPQPHGLQKESDAVIIESLTDILDKEEIENLEASLGKEDEEAELSSEHTNEKTIAPPIPKPVPKESAKSEESDDDSEGESTGPSTPGIS